MFSEFPGLPFFSHLQYFDPAAGRRLRRAPAGGAEKQDADDMDQLTEGIRVLSVEDKRPADMTPFEFNAAEQQSDPTVLRLVERLADRDSKEYSSGEWLKKEDLLYHVDILGYGRRRIQLYVPEMLQHELMHLMHHTLNSGHRSRGLYEDLRERFYWNGMKSACDQFVLRCERCNSTKPVPKTTVATGEAPETPDEPFKVLHLDYKVGLPRSGGYTGILVVVCALACRLVLALRLFFSLQSSWTWQGLASFCDCKYLFRPCALCQDPSS